MHESPGLIVFNFRSLSSEKREARAQFPPPPPRPPFCEVKNPLARDGSLSSAHTKSGLGRYKAGQRERVRGKTFFPESIYASRGRRRP